TCCVPLPSTTSPGQDMSTAQSRPSRFVSLKFPSSMWPPINASQRPWVDFAPNWHGQPQAQGQFSNSVPCITHRSATGFSSLLACSEPSLGFHDQPRLADLEFIDAAPIHQILGLGPSQLSYSRRPGGEAAGMKV